MNSSAHDQSGPFDRIRRWFPVPTGPRVVWALVAVYLVASVLLTATEFVTLTSRERERIDAKMQAAGYALDQILGEDFHERYTPASPIAHGDYRHLVVQLNRFAHHLGVE